MTQAALGCLSWWLAAQVLGLAALPITRRVLRHLPDGGYAFSKIVGLLLVSYLLWLGASTGLLQNSLGGILIALLGVAAVSAILLAWEGKETSRASWRDFWRSQRLRILVVEILFLLALAGWIALRAYTPSKIVSAYGEKYMEIAFLNGILRSPQFPPIDPWMSGYAISYYYFGYVMMAVVTRLTGAAPTVGFDLYDALLFALSACGAFGIVSNLVTASRGSQRAALGYGLLAAFFTVGMGNLEGVIHGLHSARLLPASTAAWLDIPGLLSDPQSGSFYPGHDDYHWWWWRASRVLNDLDLLGQPTGLEPITEFPLFSFLLGDNHPHKLALPFVLLTIAMAFNLFLEQAAAGLPLIPFKTHSAPGPLGLFLFYALVLGALAFLNTWDFPIYLCLTTLAYGVGRALAQGCFSRSTLLHILAAGTALGAASLCLYLFFYLGFSSQAGGVLPYVFPPTRLPQYLVMFGPFILLLACFLPLVCWQADRSASLILVGRIWMFLTVGLYGLYSLVLVAAGALLSQGMLVENGFANPGLQRWTAGLGPVQLISKILRDRLENPWTFLLLSALIATGLALVRLCLSSGQKKHAEGLPSEDASCARAAFPYPRESLPPAALFAVLLAVVGLALTLSVEFFYLRDLFSARMNTVFKFYFQGWVLMACASAYATWWMLRPGRLPPASRLFLALVTAALTAAGLVYTGMGIYSRAYGFTGIPHIDAASTMAGLYPEHWNSYPDDWIAIEWLRAQAPGDPRRPVPILLEASDGSYNHAGRFSAFTGFPAALGWDYHEYQWRGSNQEQKFRLADIRTIYTTPNPDLAFDLLRRWDVTYLILGDTERSYIEKQCRQSDPPCNSRSAAEKFNRFLTPVFTHGTTTIYLVPEP